MSKLILVPQYPTKLRYQEWWFTQFPEQFKNYFDDIITLGEGYPGSLTEEGSFAPAQEASIFEALQIQEYMSIRMEKDDVLLLNDLSFPGLFANVLFHKRPSKCFAICHATSKNAHDYYSKYRKIKYPIEKYTARIFNKVIVATQYHAEKLKGWDTLVIPFPLSPFAFYEKGTFKSIPIISVARDTKQKRTPAIEHEVETAFRCKIRHTNESCSSWEQYHNELAKSKIMLITSKEETYGYQVIDALMNDCIPIAPRHFSYPELLPDNYLYGSIGELISRLIKALADELPVPRLLCENQAKLFYQTLAIHMQE